MNRTGFKKIFRSAAVAAAGVALVGGGARVAHAVPINGLYLEDPRCDAILQQQLSHELGDAAFFPLNESILYIVQATPFQTVCVPDDGLANDWDVIIGNNSGVAWQNLFFVGDLGTKVGNADGSMVDLIGAPAVLTDAFRIDGTLTAGVNNNLLGESNYNDEIFDPGEIWRFKVSNFIDATGGISPPAFATPGVFAGSSPPGPVNSNASILAIPYVPEPTSVGVLILAGMALALRRPKRT